MSGTKAAWGRIRELYEAATQDVEETDDWNRQTPSINDAIQAEYRAGRITEAERDAMRRHVEEWLPNGGREGAYYACGMWAPSAAPMGRREHGIILSTVVILEEESA